MDRRTSTLLALLVVAVVLWLILRGTRTRDPKMPQAISTSQSSSTGEEAGPSFLDPRTSKAHRAPPEGGPSKPTHPAEEPPPESRPTTVGSLSISFTARGEPVRQGWIEIGQEDTDSLNLRSGRVDPKAGVARFENLPVGRYSVRNLLDLPSGYHVPKDVDMDGLPHGFSTWVRPGENSLEIALEIGGRVFGYLRGADGEPLEAPVVFSPVDKAGKVGRSSKSFECTQGYFEGDLREGLWLAETAGRGSRSGELQTPPEPKLVQVDPGSATRVDLALERGTGRIEGRVVDEEGKPFDGIAVVGASVFTKRLPDSNREVRIESAVFTVDSNAEGAFRADHLREGPCILKVLPGTFYPFAKRGENRIGAVDPGKVVEVQSSSTTRVELVVRRPRPVHLRVEVVVDPAWRKQSAVPTLMPAVRFLSDDVREDGTPVRKDIGLTDGRFTIDFEAALTSPRFFLKCGATEATYPIYLTPGVDPPPLVLRFPQ
jgi:hypothetical protein